MLAKGVGGLGVQVGERARDERGGLLSRGKLILTILGNAFLPSTPNGLSLFIHRVMMGEENDDNNVRIIKASNRSF